jgi:hypothetical protein
MERMFEKYIMCYKVITSWFEVLIVELITAKFNTLELFLKSQERQESFFLNEHIFWVAL